MQASWIRSYDLMSPFKFQNQSDLVRLPKWAALWLDHIEAFQWPESPRQHSNHPTKWGGTWQFPECLRRCHLHCIIFGAAFISSSSVFTTWQNKMFGAAPEPGGTWNLELWADTVHLRDSLENQKSGMASLFEDSWLLKKSSQFISSVFNIDAKWLCKS